MAQCKNCNTKLPKSRASGGYCTSKACQTAQSMELYHKRETGESRYPTPEPEIVQEGYRKGKEKIATKLGETPSKEPSIPPTRYKVSKNIKGKTVRVEQPAERKEGSSTPAQKLRKVKLTSKRPSTEGMRSPTNRELKRGKVAAPLNQPVPESRSGVVQLPNSPTVTRNETTGKAVSLKPPAKKVKLRKTTKTGKRIDQTTGKIAEPKVGQAGKLEGKLVRVTPENLQQVSEERRRTSLPTAGPEIMTPESPGPRVPLEAPQGGLREKTWFDKKAKESKRRLRGFGAPAQQVSDTAWKAMGHLDAMANHQPGSREHNDQYLGFHKAHEASRGMSSEVYDILAFAHKIATAPKYPDQAKHLNMVKDALSERISQGRAMEARRREASGGKP